MSSTIDKIWIHGEGCELIIVGDENASVDIISANQPTINGWNITGNQSKIIDISKSTSDPVSLILDNKIKCELAYKLAGAAQITLYGIDLQYIIGYNIEANRAGVTTTQYQNLVWCTVEGLSLDLNIFLASDQIIRLNLFIDITESWYNITIWGGQSGASTRINVIKFN